MKFFWDSRRREQQRINRREGTAVSADDDAGSESNLESDSVNSRDDDEEHARRKRQRLEEPVRTNGIEPRGREREVTPPMGRFSPSFTRREENGRGHGSAGDRGRKIEMITWSGPDVRKGGSVPGESNGWHREGRANGAGGRHHRSLSDHGEREHWNRYQKAFQVQVTKPKHPAHLADLDSPSGR
jgi:hypothetical protein